ncbi:MAG: hypothetical protein WC342_09425 [Methanoregula sp.]|jgi:hypothetical protein
MRYSSAGSNEGAGTAILSGPEELYSDLCTWREQLARSIARNNIGMHSGGIALAVNRIVFPVLLLTIGQDRGLVTVGTFSRIFNANERAGQPVETLREIVAEAGDLWEGIGDLPTCGSPNRSGPVQPAVDDAVIGSIAARLSADRPYDCSQMSLGEVAGVLDRYLGRTIMRSAEHRAVIVDKPGVVHDGAGDGPDPALVTTATESVLAAALAGKSPDDPVPVRIVDPACGSGRLLVAAFQSLCSRVPGSRPTFEERTEILRHCIHGLDLDPHAVAAARMLLAVAVLDNPATTIRPDRFFPGFSGLVRILSGTIRCGNALVGPEIADDESWAFCPVRERHALRPVDWHEEFPEIFSSGGFDAAICCPPSGPVPGQEWMQNYLQRHFSVYDAEAELPAFFIEREFLLVRARGIVAAVTDGRWFRARSAAPLRDLLRYRQIEEIVLDDAGGSRAGDPGFCAIIVVNRPPSRPFIVRTIRSGSGFPVDPTGLSSGGWIFRDTRRSRLLEKIFAGTTPLEQYVLGEIRAGTAVGPEARVVIDKATRDRLIREDPRAKPLVRPYLTGDAIGRYALSGQQQFCIFIPQGWTGRHPAAAGHAWRWFKKRHPGIARELRAFADRANNRSGKGECWWETATGPDFSGTLHPSILFAADRSLPEFVPGTGREIFGSDILTIRSGNLYLMGILNSRLMRFVIRETGGPGPQPASVSSGPDSGVGQLPVYSPDFDDREDAARYARMEGLVHKMLDLHRKLAGAHSEGEARMIRQEIESMDKQIDSLVFGMYGLSTTEISLVNEVLSRIPLEK